MEGNREQPELSCLHVFSVLTCELEKRLQAPRRSPGPVRPRDALARDVAAHQHRLQELDLLLHGLVLRTQHLELLHAFGHGTYCARAARGSAIDTRAFPIKNSTTFWMAS